jgi:hypothetical protein
MSDANARNPLLAFILPSIHFGACLAIWFGHIQRGWEYLLFVDFPFSVIMTGLMFRKVNQLISFGILGTLWWYFLSRVIIRWISRRSEQ